MRMVRLINMEQNETYNSIRLGNHSPDMFPIRNDLKIKGDICHHCFSILL